MVDLHFPTLFIFVVFVAVFLILQMKRSRDSARRLAWLQEQHLIVSLSDVSNNVQEFTTVVEINFGCGIEVWVTQIADETSMLHQSQPIICNGFRLYPNPKKAELNIFCHKFGLRTLKVHTMLA